MRANLLFLSLLLSWSHLTLAAELFFPLEKNQVQILPQRFEYQLIDKDQIQIGDIVINANQLDFQLLPLNKQKSQYKLRFQWPMGLLKNGEIAIKDNSGKSLFFKKINDSQIQLISKGRNSIARYETTEDVNQMIKEIQKYPFFKFCVHREEPLTKIYLCSKDIFIKRSPRGLSLLSRDSFRPESFIEINGRKVGNQGMIFLNSPREFISMRALLLSGATLELDTRMKSVQFKDVVLSSDGKEIIIRAQGAEPVDPNTVIKKSATEWETHLDVERPSTYLKGEGDLPLRQEFLVLGAIRKEDVQVQILSEAPELVYQNTLPLTLKAPTHLTLTPSDQKSLLKKLSPDTYEWTLLDLKKNEKNRRFLKISQNPNQFWAAYDVERLSAFEGNFRLMSPLWLQLNGLWALNSNWSLNFQSDHQLAKASTDPTFGAFLFGVQYRYPKGIHNRDSGFLAETYYQQIQSDVKSLGLMGVALTYELKNSGSLSEWAQWTNARLHLPLWGLDSEFKLKTSYDLELSLKRWNPLQSYYLEGGLRYQNYLIQNDTTELKLNKTHLFVGMGAPF